MLEEGIEVGKALNTGFVPKRVAKQCRDHREAGQQRGARRRGKSTPEIQVKGTLSSGDGTVLRDWALSGEGISWEALWDVADDLATGRLVQFLPEYRSAQLELYAVFAPGKPVPPRIRLFVDHLVRSFGQLQQVVSAEA
jgi:DNA-binding transcriptional LysR family regulator